MEYFLRLQKEVNNFMFQFMSFPHLKRESNIYVSGCPITVLGHDRQGRKEVNNLCLAL